MVSRWCSVQFGCSVVSYCLWPHEMQHTRLPCPSPIPWVAQTQVHWVGDAIQPSHPLSSPFPPAFNLSQHQGLLQWVSSLHQAAKVFELQHQSFQWIQDWFSLGLTGLISLPSKGLSRVFSNISSKASVLRHSAFFIVQLSHPHMTTGKTLVLTRWTFVGKVMSLLFNMLFRLVIAFIKDM